MMKFKQGIIVAIILIFFTTPFSMAYGLSNLPQRDLRIGIRFASTATPLTNISSKNGLHLGYYQGNQFYPMEEFWDSEKLLVRKDDYYLNLNGNFIEYEYDQQRHDSNANLQGPIHVEINQTFRTYEEAKSFLNSLPSINYDPYVVSESGFKVWFGTFTNYEDASFAIEEVNSIDRRLELRIIQQSNQRIQITDKNGKVLFMYDGDENVYHLKSMPSKDSISLVNIDGKNFRGSVYFKRFEGSDLTVINQLGIEEYLYGVLPEEVSASWPLEAQKAQAVSSRNFALDKLDYHGKYGFDLCTTTHCQVYGGYDAEHPSTNKAVDETRGRYLTYHGEIVTTFYHANSGGRTENSENIWSFPIDYLKAVDDPYSLGQPNDQWTMSYTKDELEEVLISKGMDVGRIETLEVTDYSENGRALKLEIKGTRNKIILEKDKIRSILGYNNIKSTWFVLNNGKSGSLDGPLLIITGTSLRPSSTDLNSKYIIDSNGISQLKKQHLYISNGISTTPITTSAPSKTGDGIVFTGKGWGHGLGMSQWGAKAMAEQGFTYDEILTYYYTGTIVE